MIFVLSERITFWNIIFFFFQIVFIFEKKLFILFCFATAVKNIILTSVIS